jgi:hypothetical protein
LQQQDLFFDRIAGHQSIGDDVADWLDRTFFTARAVVYVAAWMMSIPMLRRRRAAALFIVIFSVTVWLASADRIMYVEPHWASTIFGLYHFADQEAALLLTGGGQEILTLRWQSTPCRFAAFLVRTGL